MLVFFPRESNKNQIHVTELTNLLAAKCILRRRGCRTPKTTITGRGHCQGNIVARGLKISYVINGHDHRGNTLLSRERCYPATAVVRQRRG